MSRRPRQPSPTGLYHTMARGIDRHHIFLDDDDRHHFLDLLADTKTATGTALLAFCLMDNHIHLLLEEHDQPISTFMQRLESHYATWFNTRHDRVGPLFAGRFTSKPVTTDTYLAAVVGYIHRNPLDAGLTTHTQDYPWSSRHHLDQPDGLIDTDRLTRLRPLAAITAYDDRPSPYQPAWAAKPPSDTAARALLHDITGTDTFLTLSRVQQQTAVTELHRRGLPIRQIARLTGLTRGVITAWTQP